MKLRKRVKSGFSLIEVVISIFIIFLVLIPVMDMLVASSKKQQLAKIKQQATVVGQSLLEELSANSSIQLDGSGSFSDVDGHTFALTHDATDDSWSGSSNINGYTVNLTFAKRSNLNYTNNQKEVDSLKDANYFNVLTFHNNTLDYYDTSILSGNAKSTVQLMGATKLYLDVYKDNTNSITQIKLKRSENDTNPQPINCSLTGAGKTNIKIVRAVDFTASDDITLNIATEVADIKVDIVDEPDCHATYGILPVSIQHDSFSKNIILRQNLSMQAIAEPEEFYTIIAEVCLPNDSRHPKFKGEITKNIDIKT